MKNIAVIGAGYVGLVTAACFAELGNKVCLIEIDTKKLNALKRGQMPINEPGLPELWRRNQLAGRITVTDNYIQGLLGTEFVFIAVGTPSTRSGKTDLKWVRLATKKIAEAASGSLLVVLKSTVPLGTADLVAELLTRYGRNGYNFSVVSNPEFLREGFGIFDFMQPTRIVVGAKDEIAAEAVAELYRPLDSPTVVCDNVTAEMSKYASNVFIASRISFMNEMALVCDEYGVDIMKVTEIMGLDPRFGRGCLSAGLGWGGSCLPKDVKSLIHMAKIRGIPLRMVNAAQQVNQQQPYVVIRKLRRLLGSLSGKTIGILGLSFKPGSDDMREARSIQVISLLEGSGCHIKAYDPAAMDIAAKLMPSVIYCEDAYEVANDSEAIIIVTEWDDFRKLDMRRISSLMKLPIIIDSRNMFNPEDMAQAGFIYDGVGRQGSKHVRIEAGMV